MAAPIITLIQRFKDATQNSIRNGQPPFGDILAQFKNLDANDQNEVLNSFCQVWSQTQDSAAAAEQYILFVKQPELQREMAAKLVRVSRILAAANARNGNSHVVWTMHDAAHRHIDLADVIEQALHAANSAPARLSAV